MQARTIMVVEDELSIAEIVTEILTSIGHRVVVAHNGLEAFMRIQAERPDLVISDVMMPVMDGTELSKKLQAHPELSSVPVVFLSAAREAGQLTGCKYVAFIKKPFAINELIEVVSKTLGGGPSAA